MTGPRQSIHSRFSASEFIPAARQLALERRQSEVTGIASDGLEASSLAVFSLMQTAGKRTRARMEDIMLTAMYDQRTESSRPSFDQWIGSGVD